MCTGKAAKAGASTTAGAASAGGSALFEHLRALRKELANEQGLPPYVIFHDATLREMAERRPLSLDQFAKLRGVGQGKLIRYGERFIASVREHAERERAGARGDAI